MTTKVVFWFVKSVEYTQIFPIVATQLIYWRTYASLGFHQLKILKSYFEHNSDLILIGNRVNGSAVERLTSEDNKS